MSSCQDIPVPKYHFKDWYPLHSCSGYGLGNACVTEDGFQLAKHTSVVATFMTCWARHFIICLVLVVTG